MVIGVVRSSFYKAITASPQDTAFHASCKDSIVLPLQSGTRQSLLDSSGSELISRVNTPRPVDAFILTDAHIIVYEVDDKQGARNADLVENLFWLFALYMLIFRSTRLSRPKTCRLLGRL